MSITDAAASDHWRPATSLSLVPLHPNLRTPPLALCVGYFSAPSMLIPASTMPSSERMAR
jgi:hypothetical protein